MNQFDFSEVGRFPGTQENLSFMQEAWASLAKWMAYDAASDSYEYVILSGVEDDGVGGYTAGWVSYEGEIMQVLGGSGANLDLIEIRENVIFEGGTPKDVKLTRYLEVSAVSGAPIGIFKRFEKLLGDRTKIGLSWQNETGFFAVSRPYSIDWRVNPMTRTVHVKGTITVSTANSLPDPTIYYSAGLSLPEIAFKTPFTMLQRYHNVALGDEVKTVNAEYTAAGDIVVGLIRPPSGVTSYNLEFNQTIPMD